MRNFAPRPLEVAREALSLIKEMEQNYSHQMTKVLDPEISAMMEALKMLHWSNGKKLEDYLTDITSERPIVDG